MLFWLVNLAIAVTLWEGKDSIFVGEMWTFSFK